MINGVNSTFNFSYSSLDIIPKSTKSFASLSLAIACSLVIPFDCISFVAIASSNSVTILFGQIPQAPDPFIEM